MNKGFFFIDAETDGLYGPFISIGIIVTDSSFNEIESFYYGIQKEKLAVRDSWTIEHVLPILGEYEEMESQEELLEKAWSVWMKYRDNAYAIGDVISPVETRLFLECVKKDEANRKYLAPFPFLDISSIRYALGKDPLDNYDEEDTGKVHNALDDVKSMIHIMKKVSSK